MKHLHVSMAVTDLARSRTFYSTMFGAQPTFERDGYVQWKLDDPYVNFVIEQGGDKPGITHLGIQAQDQPELDAQFERVAAAEGPRFDEGETTCCFARSTKTWITDPDGISWETFLTHERTDEYGTPIEFSNEETDETKQCCTPETPQGVCCAPKSELAPDAPCCG